MASTSGPRGLRSIFHSPVPTVRSKVSVFPPHLLISTMSLSCLNCQSSQRTNSDLDSRHDSCHENMHCIDGERSWSGTLRTPPLDQAARNGPLGDGMMMKRTSHRGHPRLMFVASGEMRLGRGKIGTGNAGEPRLIRSSGMRRDWSFEDLRQRRDGKMRDTVVA